ncbi:glycosyltransferase family 2 protein [Spirosoma sp. KCTC 42546]|uniref:glycosyltransferase n=1 Tax=Spirosoma sp. KCTC 42546 TaxID=2520506 RepID=UPI00115A5B9E|nr:glycosyltransferase family 2 protein [Spirosoma sp. KCTC 42546]QDK79722.1 glycosyltransferase family 2 protein [Spirosoma sp. KCTC 42546]
MINFILLIITSYLLFNVLYIFISAVAGRLGHADDSMVTEGNPLRRIAVLIPAYKEDSVILGSVVANLKQSYPTDWYDLIVIADSFRPETLEQLATYPIKVIPVQFEQSTVQKSITYALNSLPEGLYDIIVISDADNHMAPDFLQRINQAFSEGWRAIQGHRVAKNTNTSVAIFDAMNEEVNNNLFRAGQRALGLSATLIGSGMGFEPAIMKRAMNQIQTVSGYDKELEMLLLVAGIKIGYLHKAFIFDEKVQNIAVFERQRTRWTAAQVYFIKEYFGVGMRQLALGNKHAFNALVKSLLLPRTLLLVSVFLLFLINLVVANPTFIGVSAGLIGLLSFSLAVSIPLYLWRKISIRDFFVLPALIFSMMRSLFKIKQAGKKFLHTPHTETPDKSSIESQVAKQS